MERRRLRPPSGSLVGSGLAGFRRRARTARYVDPDERRACVRTAVTRTCVVIGSGLVGAWTGFRLATRGVRVTVVDARLPGQGTSGTSFGWVNASTKGSGAYLELSMSAVAAYGRLKSSFVPAGCLSWTEAPSGQAVLADRGLAATVDDVAAALAEAPAHGFRLVDKVPRPGARGTTVGVVDPQREDGVLVQYVQGP